MWKGSEKRQWRAPMFDQGHHLTIMTPLTVLDNAKTTNLDLLALPWHYDKFVNYRSGLARLGMN